MQNNSQQRYYDRDPIPLEPYTVPQCVSAITHSHSFLSMILKAKLLQEEVVGQRATNFVGDSLLYRTEQPKRFSTRVRCGGTVRVLLRIDVISSRETVIRRTQTR